LRKQANASSRKKFLGGPSSLLNSSVPQPSELLLLLARILSTKRFGVGLTYSSQPLVFGRQEKRLRAIAN